MITAEQNYLTESFEGVSNRFRLMSEIVARFDADEWSEAIREWTLPDVNLTEELGACLLGHVIREFCVLRDRLNGRQATVGNHCVRRFIGLPSGPIFDALHRVSVDNGKALNPATIEHARRKHWINNWEREFYLDTWRKRKLSPRQQRKRAEINRRVLEFASRVATSC